MNSRHAHRELSLLLMFVPCLVVSIVVLLSLSLTAQSTEAASPHVDVMTLNSDISPASLQFLTRAIDTAEHDGARALVIQIDTPGGDINSMKSMTQLELASSVPIISYVSPIGGRAASAGAFLALAAHVAVMAPTTRIGASSPITSSGADIGSTLKAKIENDLVASITGIQNRYRRNADLAAKMVTDAKSYDSTTAIQQKIVDVGASNLSDLLNSAVQGRVVTLSSNHSVPLETAGVPIQTIDSSAVDVLYTFLLDPNVTFLLFIVAAIGIFLEISHPGAILPGVAGAISLLLFMLSVGSLAPNWVGLILMLLAFVLLVLDVKLPTHGVLTLGAVVSLIIGGLLLFNTGDSYGGPKMDPLIVYVMAGVIGIIGFTLVTFAVRARRHRQVTGVEGMVGASATALTPLQP